MLAVKWYKNMWKVFSNEHLRQIWSDFAAKLPIWMSKAVFKISQCVANLRIFLNYSDLRYNKNPLKITRAGRKTN